MLLFVLLRHIVLILQAVFYVQRILKQARHQCSCGDISCADLTQVEDAEIAKLVEHQKNVGLHAVTDGEFRRTFWHLDFLAALDGVKEVDAEKFSVQFKTR